MLADSPEHVTWTLAGNLPNETVRMCLAREPFDLFLNVSSSEGVPVSVMEALCSGIPVLATAVGGTPELVDDTVGRLLPADITPKQLADTLTELHANVPLLLKWRQAARERWLNSADANRNYNGFIDFLKDLTRPSTDG